MVMKEVKERVAPFWQALILLCVGCILLFSLFMFTDVKAVNLAGSSSRPLEVTDSHTSRTAPAFPADDPSCLARTQHLLYRKDSQRFLSTPEFDKAWQRYEELHAACSFKKNWTHVFLHERETHDDCNYLVVLEGGAGLGNKLLALSSAFLYAFATDRVLLIEGGGQLKNLLCEPFRKSSWFLPAEFPYGNVSDAPPLSKAIDKGYKDIDLVNLHLYHIQTWGDSQFFCDHTQFPLMDVRWLGWSSTQYYVTRLLMIPSIWERLNPLFPQGDSIFGQLSYRILLPQNSVWAHMMRIYSGYLSGSGSRIGLQIRLHSRFDLAAFDPAALERILDCLQKHKVLPRFQKKDNVESLSIRPAEGVRNASADITVLIASLQGRYYEELKDLYADQPNEANAMIRFHQVSHLDNEDHSRHQTEIAFVEMWLLSFSDVIVTSAYSTFGYVPHGIGGLQPFILNIKGENISANGPITCYEGQSSEPCTHNPMNPECTGSNGIVTHTQWMRRHIKECQDQPGGLQLVADVEQPNDSIHLWEHT